MEIRAIQDLDCIDRAKFRYLLPASLPADFLDRFSDARVTVRQFSKFSVLARDMFSIIKPRAFQADGVVGGTEILVSFHGDPVKLPFHLMESFAEALQGMGSIVYVRGAAPDCTSCKQGMLKQCAGRQGKYSSAPAI